MADYPKNSPRTSAKPSPRSNNGKRSNHNAGVRKNLKEARQAEARARAAEYLNLTSEQKLARLDKTLGKGQGARRERERLAARISREKAEAAEQKASGKKAK